MNPGGLHFRPNKVSDVAKLWLQVLQPWRQEQDFLRNVVELDQTTTLVDEKGNIDTNLFTILTHTSISSLSVPFNFQTDIDGENARERERELWSAYVREMSIFYFDLFVDYIQALIQQGIYSIDDAVVFNEVLGKLCFKWLIISSRTLQSEG